MDRKILFKPILKKGQGSGHLRRAVEMLRRFGPHSALLVQESGLEVDEVLTDLGVRKDQIRYSLDSGERWDLIVVDQRVTRVNELELLIEHGVPVALDGGGPGRAYFPFLIDCLPGNTGQAPNAYAAPRQTPNAYATPRQAPNADDAPRQTPNFGTAARLQGDGLELAGILRHEPPDSRAIALLQAHLYRAILAGRDLPGAAVAPKGETVV